MKTKTKMKIKMNFCFCFHFGFHSDIQNSMMVFTFFIFDQKYPFWTKLIQKIKIITLSWNLVPRLIRICRTQWCCSLFSFLTGNTFFRQIWTKIQNYHIKLKFGGWLNSNMQHCMKNNIFVKTLNVNIIFSRFSAFDGNIIFSVKRKLTKISYFL